MLPTPASHRIPGKPRIFFPSSRDGSYSTHASQQWLTLLRGRSRLTNLAVSLMCSLLAVSLLLNLYMFPLSGADTSSRSRWRPFTLRPSMRGWDDNATPLQLDSGIPLSIETTVDRDHRFGELEHLIMVPGHAIWLGHDASKVEEDDQWILEPMQKGGSVKTYVKHIREGVERLRQDPKALLVFSGGATRAPPSPPIPEALSYLSLAQALTILPPQTSGDNSPKGPSRSASARRPRSSLWTATRTCSSPWRGSRRSRAGGQGRSRSWGMG
ncbi:hypothetical protein EHS25_001604 [Saitozyma podzolica]|uniref:Uncharacterized protein n=1 Tax=Saitozyma podzolica TaxID=1890683 RepID=A0A427YGR5_9TREE|nr:hypothetical protein EHS25_001604 [Saitozyma podzolica]